jgi:hypothetical protein
MMDQVVEPADEPFRRRAGDRQARQRTAQPGHSRGRGKAVPADVADRQEHVPAGHLRGDVPVAAHPAVLGGRQVAHHGTQPGKIEGLLVQRQDRPLQFQRDMPFSGQLGGQPGRVGRTAIGLGRRRSDKGGHPGYGFPHPCAASGRLSGSGGTCGPGE